MAKIEAAIREGILRGARREVRRMTAPLRRELGRLREVVRRLRADVAAAREAAGRAERARAGEPWRPVATEAELQRARLSPRLIRTLRRRLALSQAGLARLVGVSAAAVVQWERGRSTPTDQNRSAIVGLRRLGRREVKQRLADHEAAGSGGEGAVRRAPRRRRPARSQGSRARRRRPVAGSRARRSPARARATRPKARRPRRRAA